MRYFVTGGTGFIGGVLIRQLRAAGHDVVALVRDVKKAAPLEALGVELAQGDVTQRGTLRAPMMGADGVFHVAAWYEVGTDPSRAEAINVEGTRNVLETMQALDVPKGVYTSTLAVNSDTKGRRVDETYRYDGPHLSVYDETKWRAHYEVAEPLIAQGLPLVIVMPGIVYGPGDTSQMGALFRRFLAGERILLPNGTAACWAHVEDVAHAHVLAMERGEPGETYIVSGPCHTWREAFETAARVTGKPLRATFVPPGLLRGLARGVGVVERWLPLPADYRAETLRVAGGTTYYGDNGRARRELGYAPRSLEDGLRDTFAAEG
ncbi:MAG TPA: NAD-dependent epimerase/dehydratase family protein [Rubricoccaceae bacterium]|nr:NAD-dependent epimerase/dehydratase family protein [Rubricoccaceae bacterium]